ncbi:hypothetical protein LTR10_011460 [Elasticomyces elasticus]|nr:hypothetical protein LTR10_011460 [Elasticomyces elasticus]
MRLKHAGIALPNIALQHQMSVGSLRALLGHPRVDKSTKDNHCVGVCQEDEQAHMVALRTDQGLSYREIMRRTGRSYSTVYRTLREALDIRRDKPRPRFSATEDAELRRLYEQEGLTWEQVATRMIGRSRKSCENRYYESVKDRRVAVGTRGIHNTTRQPKDVQLSSTTIRETSSHHPTVLQTSVPHSMRTYSTVASKAFTSTNIPLGTKYTQAEDDIILQGRHDNNPMTDIAAELGRTVKSVRGRLDLLSRERRSRAMKFSDEQTVELIRSLNAGVTRRELAIQYDVSLGQLKGQLRRLQVRLNRKSRNGAVCQAEDQALILAMRVDQSLPFAEISRRTGISEATVGRTLRRQAPRRKDNFVPYSSAEDIQLCHLREREQLTWKEVAARMHGRSPSSCMQRYHNSLQGREASIVRSATERRKDLFVPYTSAEDVQLCRLREHERLTWKEVAARMKGRSLSSWKHRYHDNVKAREVANTMSLADNNKVA